MSLFNDSFSVDEWRLQDFADPQTTDAVIRTDVSSLPESLEPTATLVNASSETREPSSLDSRPKKLSFLQLSNWDSQKTYDDDSPCCIRYDIGWTVAIKGKRGVHKDMEENQVLAPSSKWNLFLKTKVKDWALREGPASSDANNTKVKVTVGPSVPAGEDASLASCCSCRFHKLPADGIDDLRASPKLLSALRSVLSLPAIL